MTRQVFALALLSLEIIGARPGLAQRPESSGHGRIGVLVNTAANPIIDSVGARVEAVSPGGPAAKAGLQAGDIITRFNGMTLASPPGEGFEASTPGQRLLALTRELGPGDTIAVEYRRNTAAKRTKVIAEDLGSFPVVDRDPGPLMGPLPPGFSFCFGDAWCEVELVALNPDLGDYFGTKDGILVVKAPPESSLPLKSGDVLLTIGGRQPPSPSYAMRILRSYAPGESVTIEIMRRHKKTNVVWQVPREEGPTPSVPRMHQMVSDSHPAPPD
ncbi:MAG TPA: PDZ domain-containing protein [Gemmatimonadales bacterium]|nr:PDZ domain-containing protein [Gemmatimonadales bacterium]